MRIQTRASSAAASLAVRTREAERGQVLPLVALAFVALLGMAALAFDVGYYRYQQRVEQAAADSAAIAAAVSLIYSSSADVLSVARLDAQKNGFTDDGGTTVSVTVNHPYNGDSNAVEVLVTKKQPIFFSGVLGVGTPSVTVRAAGGRNNAGSGCVYSLSGDITLKGGGGGGVNAGSCDVISNAKIDVTGNAPFNAGAIGYVTGVKGCSACSPQPTQSIPVVDPCLTIPGCVYLTANPPPHTGTACVTPSQTGTLSPGEYCSTLNISGNTVLNPGIYTLDQGLNSSGTAVITQNTGSPGGVTFYNLGTFTMSGSSSATLSAPTSGSTAGVLFYQPKSNTAVVTIDGSSGTDILAGALYLPSANLIANANITSVTELIAASITLNGGGITVAAPATGANPGLAHVVLIE